MSLFTALSKGDRDVSTHALTVIGTILGLTGLLIYSLVPIHKIFWRRSLIGSSVLSIFPFSWIISYYIANIISEFIT